MNELIKWAMGAGQENPFSFMALLASTGGVPGYGETADLRPALADRAFFKAAHARIEDFAARHRYDGYSFFDLMEDKGLMPQTADLADWMDEAARRTIANVLGTAANDNIRGPRLVPPSGGIRGRRRPKAA